MAGETESATAKIENMLRDFTVTIRSVVEVTDRMVDMIQDQSEVTEKTVGSFEQIAGSTGIIIENSNELKEQVKELAQANSEIGDSISTISAITEEVSAHAGDTYGISETNMDIVSEVVEAIEQIKELAERLNSKS